MITLRKLRQLSFKTRLRKISLVLQEFENSSLDHIRFQAPYLTGLLDMLVHEESLDKETRDYVHQQSEFLKISFHETRELIYFNRLFNAVRHRLLAVLGAEPADWDFQIPERGGGGADNHVRTVLPIYVYVDEIRSPFNVGSIFRTAEAFGVAEIVLSSGAPSPEHSRTKRSAMGATHIVSHQQLDNKVTFSDFFKEQLVDTPCFALETGGTNIEEFTFPPRGIVVIGNEELGVDPDILSITDNSAGRVSIPMGGAKASLGVAVAFGILMQRWNVALRA